MISVQGETQNNNKTHILARSKFTCEHKIGNGLKSAVCNLVLPSAVGYQREILKPNDCSKLYLLLTRCCGSPTRSSYLTVKA